MTTPDSQRGLRLLSGATDEGIAIVENRKIIEINVSIAKLLSYDPDEMIGLELEKIFTPETWGVLNAKLNTGDDESYQGVAVGKSGATIPIQLNGREMELDEKTVIVINLSDLTQLKLIEEELRQSEKRYRTLFNTMLHGFILHEIIRDDAGDPVDFCVLEVNPAFETITGLKAEEVVGSRKNDHRPGIEPKWLDLYSKVIAKGSPVRLERHFGELDKYLELVAFSPQVGKLATILGDMTERRKLEARLRQAAKMEAIGTLASGVAHEINNPINIIMNYAGLILREGTSRDDTQTFAKEIVNESERIATIVRNLLAFARQEKELPEKEHISDVIESTLSLMQKVLDNDQIKISVEIDEGLPQVRCQRQQIEQVLVNLLTNARQALNEKYSGYDEDKKLTVKASLVEVGDEGWIRTTVEDKGPGIPSELIDRIFDPFFTTKPGGTGTGLGLSVSHGIVDDHGGRLTVESQIGHYCRFHLELPLRDSGEEWTIEEMLEFRHLRVKDHFR